MSDSQFSTSCHCQFVSYIIFNCLHFSQFPFNFLIKDTYMFVFSIYFPDVSICFSLNFPPQKKKQLTSFIIFNPRLSEDPLVEATQTESWCFPQFSWFNWGNLKKVNQKKHRPWINKTHNWKTSTKKHLSLCMKHLVVQNLSLNMTTQWFWGSETLLI